MAELKGIDISSYQAGLDLHNVAYDFVLIKATQGVAYTNPYCDTHFQQAQSQGKKIGVYHYADGNDAIAEANYFVDTCAGYIRHAMFVLDWEGEGTEFTDWALTFLRQVEARIGYKPVIYMSESVVNRYSWSAVVAGDYGLWVAKYADNQVDNNYDMSNAGPVPDVNWWPFYLMWQWTSTGRLSGYAGNLDCNVFYGDAKAWDAYAGVAGVQAVPTTTATTQTTTATTHTTTATSTSSSSSTSSTTSTLPPIVPPAASESLWDVLKKIYLRIIKFLKGEKL